MTTVGDIAINVTADVGPLRRGMGKASRSLKDFQRDADVMARRFARVGVSVAAAAAAMAVGVAAMGRSAGAAAKEIETLSRLSGVGTTEFQKLAAAGRTVGFSQEKMADIFKDVNDKFGDFMANGAGPLKDFFDNVAPAVGVTAEQFARLSGPEALQLYVRSLERANLTQQQMTFYMEALANDATALLPILRNNGEAIRRLGQEAQDAGQIFSEEMIRKGVEMDRKFTELSETIRRKAQAAILEYSDEIIAMADWVAGTAIPALVSFGEQFAAFLEKLQPAIDGLREFMGLVAAAAGVEVGPGATLSPEEAARRGEDVMRQPGEGDPSRSGQFYVDENGNVQEYGAAPEIPGITVGRPQGGGVPLVNTGSGSRSRGGGGGGGGGASGPTREDFEAFAAQLATEAEAIALWREEELERLREFRESKLATEEEFNELEGRIQAEHAERMAEIEERRREAVLQGYQSMFGDLASLMSSQNEKMFKVGKAAAIAEAIVSGYRAAVDAWQKGMAVGGPGVAAAFSAASLARTGALISGIASTNINGGGGGGAALGGGGTAAASGGAGRRDELDVRVNVIGDLDTASNPNVINTITEGILENLRDRDADIVRVSR